jgi:hypothetical protein
MKLVNVYFLLIFTILFFINARGLAQDRGPSAVITVEALSPGELAEMGWTTTPSSGLKTVGQGELVYLSGKEANGEEVTSYTWSIENMPLSAAATLDSTNTAWTTFRPDTTGKYIIKLAITTASGAADTTVTITSAHYVGVGIVGGLVPDFTRGQCAICHAAPTTEWKQTGHATMFELAIDGLKSSHYRESCIECHTVGYDTSATAVNGGFDDVARELGWTFPNTLQPGNWANIVTNFPVLAHVSNIQCENCHGPGSQHFGNPGTVDVSLDEGVCGRCHDEPPQHSTDAQWKNSLHAVGVASAAGRAGCADCHSGYGFIHMVDPATRLEQTTGSEQTTCQVCHDPHSIHGDENNHQLRTLDDVTLTNGVVVSSGGHGKLCMNCHKSRVDAATYTEQYASRFGPHHGPQADMLAGTNGVSFGMYVASSTHRDVVPDACVTCHMSATPAAGQPGNNLVGGHTFAMHWDGGTPDDTIDEVENVAVCANCHGPINSFADIPARADHDGDGTIEGAQAEMDGLMEEVAMLLPPVGSPTVTVTANYNKVQLKAAFNYTFVEEDGSHGIHNYQYAIGLLKVAKAALTYGVLQANEITSISDVPNDQGKQVRIMWDRFGGDGVSDNPVTYYAVWRRVDDAMKMAKTAGPDAAKHTTIIKAFENLPDNPSTLAAGTVLALGDQAWDYVGSVPAAAQDTYSTVVPTLFDSTKDGIKWSVFMVSGHTAVPAVYAMTSPDSGYSIDNLAPAAPGNVVLSESASGINLVWDDPVDEDFNYFAIYRSTSAGFDPTGTEPIATVIEAKYTDADVAAGSTYFYRLSAFDFAGNQSVFSPEKSLVVTGVTSNINTIPDDFALEQNYPNPFNPSTMIQFALPKADRVRIEIFDIRGALVKTLVDDKFSAGYHAAVWNGLNDAGYSVSAGTYLYRMVSSNGTITKKMVYMK